MTGRVPADQRAFVEGIELPENVTHAERAALLYGSSWTCCQNLQERHRIAGKKVHVSGPSGPESTTASSFSTVEQEHRHRTFTLDVDSSTLLKTITVLEQIVGGFADLNLSR